MFRFLGVEGDLKEIGWDGPEREKLWRYNQHYFDDLNAAGADARVEWHAKLLASWLQSTTPGQGNGWEPYPTSLRIVNWVKWAVRGHLLPADAVQSLAMQARWLTKRLEVHLLGNHLFANAKALIHAGLFFEGAEAEQWLRKGLAIVERELPEQMLGDGGHFERSPMYHIVAMEDLLDLINLAQSHPQGERLVGAQVLCLWRDRAVDMQHWLQLMCHPDGEISFFNDAAMGSAPTPEQVMEFAERVLGRKSRDNDIRKQEFAGVNVFELSESGYIRVEAGRAVLLLDVAPIGPDYLPGHAHADTLSFEVSLDGKRVLVNSGTSQYGDGPERLRQRGTAAHNTVVVDGQDSSEVWGGFRVARRAYPFGLQIEPVTGGVRITCSHDGYKRLRGRPVHQREWVITTSSLRVQDRLRGSDGIVAAQTASARFHLNPDVTGVESGDGVWQLERGGERPTKVAVRQGTPSWEASTWHPEFGRVVPNTCLDVELAQGRASVHMDWGDFGGD